ncbi:hypothetical protein [Methyloprofundus sp.]
MKKFSGKIISKKFTEHVRLIAQLPEIQSNEFLQIFPSEKINKE